MSVRYDQGHFQTIILSLCGLLYATQASALTEMVFEDTFGRRVNEHGLILLDWEGQIANPAIQVYVKPPADAAFPGQAIISSTEPRLYFDLPSDATATGPAKTMSFPDATTTVPFFVAIFPDRDTQSEDHVLSVQFTDANGIQRIQALNLHVIDQDSASPPPFNVIVDFTQDQTGFFDDPVKRGIVQQAAQDWAYFFADMNLDMVPAGAEETFIWDPDGFNSGNFIHNTSAYRGFLLYAYGIDSATQPYRSGGEPSATGGFQSSGGTPLPLRRSGGVEIEIKGNFNTLGWFLTSTDDDWWKASNFGNEQNDLYSIARHEIGHSLIFNPAHTRFGQFKSAGSVQDAQVLAYQGSYPGIDSSDHLNGSIDRLSKKGAFGYEYFGDVPARRWLITKLDVLVAQAIGYTLRQTSAFIPLQIVSTGVPRGALSTFYWQQMTATGGIPAYDWSVISGALPGGLSLDPFSGVISGTPNALGTFNFTIRLRDNDSVTTPLTRPLSIRIEATPFEITAVQKGGADIQIKFTTAQNHNYRVDYKNDLADSWTTLIDGVPGTGGIVPVTDSNAATLGKRFYQVTEL
ncbi:MAG: hypothetical protein QOI22_1007 [Verrucomicrobiota bacterium]